MKKDQKKKEIKANKQITTADNIEVQEVEQSAEQPIEQIVRKFELAVFNENLKDDGSIELKQERLDKPLIVGVKTYADLMQKMQLYKDCGQVAKIIREIDPPPKDKIDLYNQIFYNKNPSLSPTQIAQTYQTNQQSQPQKQVVQVQKRKPKFYKIGDIEIKDDNGKIYQKQWMRLSDSESANFRLINDKNNSLVSLNGKHLEMKKWVIVEDSENDETTSLEENLK